MRSAWVFSLAIQLIGCGGRMSSTEGSARPVASRRERDRPLPPGHVRADATLSDAARALRALTTAAAAEDCLFVFGAQVRPARDWPSVRLTVEGQEPLSGHLVCGAIAADVRAQTEGRPGGMDPPPVELQVLAEWNGSAIVLRHPNATESITVEEFVRNGLQMPYAGYYAYFAPRADVPSRMDSAMPELRRLGELTAVAWMLE